MCVFVCSFGWKLVSFSPEEFYACTFSMHLTMVRLFFLAISFHFYWSIPNENSLSCTFQLKFSTVGEKWTSLDGKKWTESKSKRNEKEIKLIFNDEDAQVTFAISSQLLHKVSTTHREYLPLAVHSKNVFKEK